MFSYYWFNILLFWMSFCPFLCLFVLIFIFWHLNNPLLVDIFSSSFVLIGLVLSCIILTYFFLHLGDIQFVMLFKSCLMFLNSCLSIFEFLSSFSF